MGTRWPVGGTVGERQGHSGGMVGVWWGNGRGTARFRKEGE